MTQAENKPSPKDQLPLPLKTDNTIEMFIVSVFSNFAALFFTFHAN